VTCLHRDKRDFTQARLGRSKSLKIWLREICDGSQRVRSFWTFKTFECLFVEGARLDEKVDGYKAIRAEDRYFDFSPLDCCSITALMAVTSSGHLVPRQEISVHSIFDS
jgi:hypothetical protein